MSESAGISITCLQGKPFLNSNLHIDKNLHSLVFHFNNIYLLIESLDKCCQHIAMVVGNGVEDSEWTGLDHLLGYYKMEGVYNQVFSYNQKTLRHNIFVDGNGILPPEMIPVFLKMYQVITMRQILSSLCIDQLFLHLAKAHLLL